MIPLGIITYKRSDRQLTLRYLTEIGYPKEFIHIFVQTEKDFAAYQVHAGQAQVHYYPGENVAQNRNNCLSHFQAGQQIVQLDDDMRYLAVLSIPAGKRGDKSAYKLRKIETIEEFTRILKIGFQHSKKVSTILWGMYPVCNAYFMKPNITDWTLLIGNVLGITVTNGITFDPLLTHKEDYDFCCQVLRKYGAVIRFNGMVPYYVDRQPDALTFTDSYSTAAKKAARRCLVRNKDLLTPKKKNRFEVTLRSKKGYYGQFA